jgi:hypothetical protein
MLKSEAHEETAFRRRCSRAKLIVIASEVTGVLTVGLRRVYPRVVPVFGFIAAFPSCDAGPDRKIPFGFTRAADARAGIR